jgi:hypothetical protein
MPLSIPLYSGRQHATTVRLLQATHTAAASLMTCARTALIAVLTALVPVPLLRCMCCLCSGAFQPPPLQRLSLSQLRIPHHTSPIAAKLVKRGLAWHGGCWICALSMPSSSGQKGRSIQDSYASVRSSCTSYCSSCRPSRSHTEQAHAPTLPLLWPRTTTLSAHIKTETVHNAVFNLSGASVLRTFAMRAKYIFAAGRASLCTTRSLCIALRHHMPQIIVTQSDVDLQRRKAKQAGISAGPPTKG